jgi:tetratricopeptide (TPR) repeat protein
VLALLSSLVDKSLVIADVSAREPRYRLLASTRQYAREKLAARGDAAAIARRHAELFADVAERCEGAIAKASDTEIARAVLDLDNWRAALHWALAERGDPAFGQRIAAAIWNVWIDVSIVEGRRWVALAAARCDQDTPARLKLRLAVAELAMAGSFGEWDAVIAAAPRLLGTCREIGATAEAAYVAWWSGESLVCLGRVAEGEPLLREALELARALGHRRLTARSLENVGYARSMDGDLAAARAAFSESLAILHEIGADARTMGALSMLAEAEFRAGNVERAVELVAHALARQRDVPKTGHLMTLLINYAAYLIACDRFPEAREAAREAVLLSQEAQRNVYQAWAVQHLAAVAALVADGRSAMLRTAAQLLGYVDGRITALRSPREHTEQQEYDRVLGVLRGAFGANVLDDLLAVGALFAQNEAIRYALEIDV